MCPDNNWEQVGPLMRRVLADLGLLSQVKLWEAAAHWDDIAGAKIAGKTKVVRVDGGVLWLQASGPQWVTEVTIRKSEILDKLNERAGTGAFKDIRFTGAWNAGKPSTRG